MTSLKLALFSFICAIVFAIAATITGVFPITILALVSVFICIGALLTWLCAKILKRFKHSLNIVLIIVFFVLAVICYLFQDAPVSVETLADFTSLSYISIAWIAAAFACCSSILVLIGRLIFEKKERPIESPVDAVNSSEEYTPYNQQ